MKRVSTRTCASSASVCPVHQETYAFHRSDTKACPLENSLWTRHEGLAAVAHEIYDWCRSKHGHSSPTRTSPRTKKPSADDASSLTTYRHVPSVPPPTAIRRKPQGPYTTRARTGGAIIRESKTASRVSSSRSAAGSSASSSAKPRRSTTPPSAPVSPLVGYVATSEGDIFRTEYVLIHFLYCVAHRLSSVAPTRRARPGIRVSK